MQADKVLKKIMYVYDKAFTERLLELLSGIGHSQRIRSLIDVDELVDEFIPTATADADWVVATFNGRSDEDPYTFFDALRMAREDAYSNAEQSFEIAVNRFYDEHPELSVLPYESFGNFATDSSRN